MRRASLGTRARSRGWFFRTKQPHHVSWLIALLLAVVGGVASRVHIEWVSSHVLWMAFGAYAVLALSTVIDGL